MSTLWDAFVRDEIVTIDRYCALGTVVEE